jgi:two-component system CheB/CheR fusion protein
LVDVVNIPVLFVDRELRVTRFTPAITQIFPLLPIDRGRLLTDFANKLPGLDLMADLNAVLCTGREIEREVRVAVDDKSRAALMRIRPYRGVDGNTDGMVLTFFDIDAISIAAHGEIARYAALCLASGDAIIGISLEGMVTAWSPGAERLLGYTAGEIEGKHISILALPGREHEQSALLEQVCSGKEVAPYDSMQRRKDGTIVQVSIRAGPVLSGEGVPVSVCETMHDITERRQAEERTALLTRELAHRTRNLLSVVHATMVHTAENSTDKESFIRSVDDRLRTMSQAHDLLIANNLKGAPAADLVRSCLKPFVTNEENLEIHGPAVMLNADAVHNFSLVLHELATNALKYGALTRPQGKVLVSWELDGPENKSPRFRMSWREMGGPSVVPPQRTGFGTSVISEAPKHELDAEVTLAYEAAGVSWSIDMPADRAVAEETMKVRGA